MPDLADRKCVPCRGGTPPLKADQIKPLLSQLAGWKVVANHHIEKTFEFPDFRSALDFVNRIGEVAEREDHHPDLELSWGRVGVRIWTHKIDGLTESDFILAAKIDRAPKTRPQMTESR
jgi:4a-hydroxytetrahydrobiopterin dehydratase